MEYGLKRIHKLPLSARLMRELHQRLMKGVRGGHVTPGEFRTTQNWIGPPGCMLNDATYVPPPVDEMNECLSALEKYLHAEVREPPLIQCALAHYQFEAIHPFVDGNGRVGRLFITLFLCERKLLAQPLLYLSAFFERHRDEYYRRLLAVSREGDWNGWLEYFLRGVAVQAREALADSTKIIKLHADYRARLGTRKVPQAALRLVDRIFENPVVSVARLSEEWKMPFPSVQRGVARLVQAGIMKEATGQQRNQLYVAEELMKLILPK